ncbi:MAG: GNAT family N-acetyltransferase [Syntrophobacteraceae bacterium]|nr:GNAT family N-acetyltransferase [Syntrophobacteraceae bacterium]
MPDGVRSELARSVTFRESVRPSDREWVLRIVGSSGFFSEQETAVAAELVEEAALRGKASGYSFLFAERGREVLGYTCFGPIACTRSSFDLYWIAVLPEIRGMGLGRKLLRRSESLICAAGGTRIYVETSSRPLYEPTRIFYEHNGYRKEAVLPDFYAPDDHKIVYVKGLDESNPCSSTR